MSSLFERQDRENAYQDNALANSSGISNESTTLNQGMRLVGEVEGSHDFYLNGVLAQGGGNIAYSNSGLVDFDSVNVRVTNAFGCTADATGIVTRVTQIVIDWDSTNITTCAAADGEIVMPTSLLVGLLMRMPRDRGAAYQDEKGWERLTVREQEVLELLASGKTGDEIAESLHIAPLTVRTHIRNLMAKMGVHSRLEAVTFGIKNGIIDSPA